MSAAPASDPSQTFPTFRHLDALRRKLRPVARARLTAVLLAAVSLVTGLAIVIYDGFILGQAQYRLYWIASGLIPFYLPGAAYALAWWGLGNSRPWTAHIAMAAAAVQAGCAVFFAVSLTLVSVSYGMFVIGGLLGIAIDAIFILQLRRALPWVRADASKTHGFMLDDEVVEAETV